MFGELGGNTAGQVPDIQGQTEDCPDVLGITPEETAKDLEIKMLREQLEKSEQREQWLQSQVQNLTDTVKLLEAPQKAAASTPLVSVLEVVPTSILQVNARNPDYVTFGHSLFETMEE